MARIKLTSRRYWCPECRCYFRHGNPLCPQCGWKGRLAPEGDDTPPPDPYADEDDAALAEVGL